jgi:hypothetical protein
MRPGAPGQLPSGEPGIAADCHLTILLTVIRIEAAHKNGPRIADRSVAEQRQAANLLANPAFAPCCGHVLLNTDHVYMIVIAPGAAAFFQSRRPNTALVPAAFLEARICQIVASDCSAAALGASRRAGVNRGAVTPKDERNPAHAYCWRRLRHLHPASVSQPV